MRQIELVTHDNVQCNCLCPYTMTQKDISRYSSFIVSSKDIGKLHSNNQCCHACDAQCARDIEELCNVDMEVCWKGVSVVRMWCYGIIQSQHCNNDSKYNDDKMMFVNVWLEFIGGLLQWQNS